ncbi:MAG: hypothetical protein COY58_08240 [Gammaproteobacteria bacterium CG_4_10_14_0_8_um_filter_38_16]|nr:MAG: hypothetical protein COY58_08240 [Gammaproteobacteria bacterium CG_4_10_14_0_8_um_filter_38_16]PJA04300.1 MAG: hypothetical protein COX72_00755 [Gammaproteobacteria bacterium CG_4_10_14_0_2_um_filter_38_22]PJB09622.1 MAG: hypothetical protein CO120_09135 [Gammaproteobacteria bacterium CG_4_9_14_3_um_filter_38_9]
MLLGACISSFVLLSGCSVSDMKEAVGVGNATRTSNVKLKPIQASQVRIYNRIPAHYKVVGRISADNYSLIGMEHSQKNVISELKKQAASLGANGVLLIHSGLDQTTAEAILVK